MIGNLIGDRTKSVVFIFGAVISLSAVSSEQIYQWRNANGVMNFSDLPPPVASKGIKIRELGNVPVTPDAGKSNPYSVLNQLKRMEEDRLRRKEQLESRRQRLQRREIEVAAPSEHGEYPYDLEPPLIIIGYPPYRPPWRRLPPGTYAKTHRGDHPVYRPRHRFGRHPMPAYPRPERRRPRQSWGIEY